MWPPFVSGSRFREKAQEVNDLKRELREAQQEVKYLNNQMVWRTNGVATYPELLPEQYRPQFSADQPQAAIDPMKQELPTELGEAMRATGSRHPRALTRALQATQDQFSTGRAPLHAAKVASVQVAAAAFEQDLKTEKAG